VTFSRVTAAALFFLLSPGGLSPSTNLQVEIEGPALIPGAEDGTLHPIFRGPAAGPLLRLRDGSLLLCGSDSSLLSRDLGKNWSPAPPVPGLILERRDGSVLIFGGSAQFYLTYGYTRPGPNPGLFSTRVLRLAGAEQLAAPAPSRWSEATVRVEQFSAFNSNTGEEVSTPFVTGPLVELGDGTLLAANYGKFAGDAARAPGFDHEKGKYFRNRTYLLASHDGGTQWSYLATVAYDGRTGQESFCEPSLVDLGNGELLAVMRTGHFSPLYQARSMDGGKSWGEPESLHVPGLSPQLARLDNGVLVCSFGWRPTKENSYYAAALDDYRARYRTDCGIEDPSSAAGDYVMASADGGRTWTRPRRIADPLTLGFTRLAPSGPDSCVVVSQRLAIPSATQEAVLAAWRTSSAPGMAGWEEWCRRSRRQLEVRWIRVRR